MDSVANTIIDALGGTTAVARMTDAPTSTVHSWRKNGIPRSRLAHLRLAVERGGLELNWETGARIEHSDADTCAPQQSSPGNETIFSPQVRHG